MSPSRLASFLYWKKTISSKPALFSGITIEGSRYIDFVRKWGDKCPMCKGFQQGQNDEDQVVYCLCSMLRWLEEEHEILSDVETRAIPAKLNDLKPLQKYPGAKTLEKVKSVFKEWVNKPDHWIVLAGGTGTGKTHILRAIKNYFGNVAFYISAEDFNSAIFKYMKDKELDVFINHVANVPILLFDDFGIQHDNAMFLDTFAAVVNRRNNAGAENYPIVMTTNLSPTVFVKTANDQMARIGSRLLNEAVSQVFWLDQPDYRLKTTEKQ